MKTKVDWDKVFELRCRSKRGEKLSKRDFNYLSKACNEDLERYKALDKEIFIFTAPFGSNLNG